MSGLLSPWLALHACLELYAERHQPGDAFLEVLLDLLAFGQVLDEDHRADDRAVEGAQRRRRAQDRLLRAVEAPDRHRLAVRRPASQRPGERRVRGADQLPAPAPAAHDLA